MDLLGAVRDTGYRRQMAEHGEGARRLLQRAIKHNQVVFGRRVAEEGIQRLLDLGQVVLDFTGPG